MKRRQVIKGLIIGGAALAVPGVLLRRRGIAISSGQPSGMEAGALAPSERRPKPVAAGRAPVHNDGPWWMLSPLKANEPLAFGWRISALGAMRKGAMVAVLQRGGERVDVHICRRSGAAKGIGYSRRFDLILMNGHGGDAPTNEKLGRIVKSLGWIIQDAERAHPLRTQTLLGAMSHAERVDRYGPQGLA